MPITETLENARKLEAAGFNHAQAQSLAEVIESGAYSAREDLATKELVRIEIQGVRAEIQGVRAEIQGVRAEIQVMRGELKAEFHRELRQQMLWFFAILIPLLGALAAYIKHT
ncbi:MAG: CCDC90 family protein [Deltaproteobacteria bacterium]|nr:CCDC90 family protein [Deltaproteobacteria bacterium]